MPHSISSTAKDLSVSKVKLYKMIRQAGVEPVPFGNRKIIRDTDFKKLRQILIDEGRQPELLNSNEDTVRSANRNGNDQTERFIAEQPNIYLTDLLTEKDLQIERLEKQLSEGKAEKQGLQQGLMQLQDTMLQLDKRISLLQPPNPHESQEVRVRTEHFKEAEQDIVVEPEPQNTEPNKHSKPTGGWFSRIFAQA